MICACKHCGEMNLVCSDLQDRIMIYLLSVRSVPETNNDRRADVRTVYGISKALGSALSTTHTAVLGLEQAGLIANGPFRIRSLKSIRASSNWYQLTDSGKQAAELLVKAGVKP